MLAVLAVSVQEVLLVMSMRPMVAREMPATVQGMASHTLGVYIKGFIKHNNHASNVLSTESVANTQSPVTS